MSVPHQLEELVDRFVRHRREYEATSYLEARVRVDFLNPLFELLGWDVSNSLGVPEHEREVITESRLRVGSSTKAPDYLFQTRSGPAFLVEAKKPAVNLRVDPLPALQLRRYGWNSGNLTIGILTDFQEFSIYDFRVPPTARDRASTALLDYLTFDQYVDRWSFLKERFHRDAVYNGSIQNLYGTTAGTRGRQRVDKLFLTELENWRVQLAEALASKNTISLDELNYAVQVIIDRIVFLRVCEDRGLEPYGGLESDISGRGPIYERLVTRFERADEKYNSGLFHFRPGRGRGAPDSLTPSLRVADDVMEQFIRRLYWPAGPYDFAVLPPDILGRVYEQFLGQVIALDGRRVSVDTKPEVRKAGGVFYTPTHIVRDIVRSTLERKLSSATPERLSRRGFYVCDPSCGSGSFLIEVYQYFLDWYLKYYVDNNPERWTRSRPTRLERTANGEWRLTPAERKRILLAHIYGVDIDPQAVEVTKLALLLKVLEGETDRSVNSQMELFHERALPNIDDNIKCGNSLIGNSFHFGQGMLPDPDMERRVNAFDWEREFSMVAGGRGFDVVVGNPPWLMAGYYVAESVPYLQENYLTATGKFDLYYVFVEQSLRLLAENGTLGLIIPSKLFHTRAAAALRVLLASSGLRLIKDFGVEKVFERATNYSCIIVADKTVPSDHFDFARVTAQLDELERFEVQRDQLAARTWNFEDPIGLALFDKLRSTGVPLERLIDRFATGVQSGSDRLLTFTKLQAAELGLETDILRPVLRGRDVRGFRIRSDSKLLLFPYAEVDEDFKLLSANDLKRFPNAWAYLLRHRDALAKRIWFDKSAEELSGEWYGLMYVERAAFFSRPHILTPCLVNVANFALGTGAVFATGTAGVAGLAPKRESVDIRYLLGVLNSDVLSVFATSHSPIYQGGYRKFSAPYLKGLPIPIPDLRRAHNRSAHDRIISLVEETQTAIARIAYASTPHQTVTLQRRADGARAAINGEVRRLFALSDKETQWISGRYRPLAVLTQEPLEDDE